jgi:hypothetical protein
VPPAFIACRIGVAVVDEHLGIDPGSELRCPVAGGRTSKNQAAGASGGVVPRSPWPIERFALRGQPAHHVKQRGAHGCIVVDTKTAGCLSPAD